MHRTRPVYQGTTAAFILLLIIARASGVTINRTKLAKLLYLADLEAVRRGLPPGTDVEWKWRHYGPHSQVISDVEQDLRSARVIELSRTVTTYGGVEARLRLREADPAIDIDEEFAGILTEIMREYSHRSAAQLKNIAYQTPPMVSARALGRREKEVVLDLTGGNPYIDISPAVARFQKILAEMPKQVDEPGAVEELATEMETWAPFGRHANSQMLDVE